MPHLLAAEGLYRLLLFYQLPRFQISAHGTRRLIQAKMRVIPMSGGESDGYAGWALRFTKA